MQLKGCAGARVKEEVREMIKLLKLESKTNVASSGLSGGMKRKLSVGIALIGGSKVSVHMEFSNNWSCFRRNNIPGVNLHTDFSTKLLARPSSYFSKFSIRPRKYNYRRIVRNR